MAEVYNGITFPQGASSFADQVIQFDPLLSGGPGATDERATNPAAALGEPDYSGYVNYVTLGNGGQLELAFTDNLLTNSGNSNPDLYIFEIGPVADETFVEIRPTPETLSSLNQSSGYSVQADKDSDGFIEVGTVAGSTSSIDIDAFFPGVSPGQLKFDAVQLRDNPDEKPAGGEAQYPGADIDAVGAISSETVSDIPPSGQSEEITAPFTGGPSAVTTRNTYTGPTEIVISGTGQAAETSYSDAFYLFTDTSGNNISPVSANEFGLYINGDPAQEIFSLGQTVPAYNPQHSYSFRVDASGGPLTLGVGDLYTIDNTGSYTITVTDVF